MIEKGKEGTEFWEKEQSKVLGEDRKEKGRRRMACLRRRFRWLNENLFSSCHRKRQREKKSKKERGKIEQEKGAKCKRKNEKKKSDIL